MGDWGSYGGCWRQLAAQQGEHTSGSARAAPRREHLRLPTPSPPAQCWCTLDLATYFGEAAAEAPAEHQPAKPPTLLMTHMADSSGHTLSASGDADTEPATAAVAAEEAAAREAAAEAAVAAAGEQDAQQEGQQEEGQQAPPKASLSQRTLGPLHGGDVLQVSVALDEQGASLPASPRARPCRTHAPDPAHPPHTRSLTCRTCGCRWWTPAIPRWCAAGCA